MNSFDANNRQNNGKPASAGDTAETGISHSLLHLGGGGPIKISKEEKIPVEPEVSAAIEIEPVEEEAATAPVVSAGAVSGAGAMVSGRITGVRTFFTKLHAGAINFLDEQMTEWLKKNPDIVVKRTNITTGPITGKKIEPNIIITVWY